MTDQRIHIVLDRLRSAHNVGNIFRIAEAVGAVEVIGCGCTPLPPHPKLEKTAMGTDLTVPCRRFGDSLAALRALPRTPFDAHIGRKTRSAALQYAVQFRILYFGQIRIGDIAGHIRP